MLIDDLKALQSERGWLSDETIAAYCENTGTPLYAVQAVTSFYPHFRREPPPACEMLVCRDLSCRLRGAPRLLDRLRSAAPPGGRVAECSCLGLCDRAPAMAVDDRPFGPVDPETRSIPSPPEAEPPAPVALDPYGGRGEYRVVADLAGGRRAADDVVQDLVDSGLRGMGGAGFPAGRKWDLVRRTTGPIRYVVCNADESEPGTFKDREILIRAPHLVLEGMLVAAQVVGASEAILYLRHEYPQARDQFAGELQRARGAGLLPPDIEVRIFDSPGGYICGEETALLEALEGKRAEPRNKPPFPGTHGLWGRPTLINNVETLALVTAILAHGVQWYRSQGVNGGVGPKFVGLSGDVLRPGVYEIPLGLPLRDLIEQYGGGMLPGRSLKAICPGGASSGFIPAALADTPLDFDALARAGSMLGSGAVIAIGEGRCMLDLAINLLAFFRNESCGKCVPCRVGTQKLVDVAVAWSAGSGSKSGDALVEELSAAMADASICGLGQIAPAPLASVLKHWPDEVRAHRYGRGCPHGVCPAR